MLSKIVWKQWTLILRVVGLGLFLSAASLILGAGTAEAAVVSGTVRDQAGNPLAGASVQVYGNDVSHLQTWYPTASTGTFSFGNMPAGTYSVTFRFTPGNQYHTATTNPGIFTAQKTVTLAQNTVLSGFDITLNLVPVEVTVLDEYGMPLTNIGIEAKGSALNLDMGAAGIFNSGDIQPGFSVHKTDTLGKTTVYLPKDLTYSHLIARPSVGDPYYTDALGTLTGPTSITITRPPTRTFSGTFRDALGNPLPNVSNSMTISNGVVSKTVYITNGTYSVSLLADTYSIMYNLEGTPASNQTTSTPALPPGALRNNQPVPLDLSAGNVTNDLSFDLVPYTVNVLTANGEGFPNAAITASGTGPTTINTLGSSTSVLTGLTNLYSGRNYYRLPTTDANGKATVYLPTGMTITSLGVMLPLANPFNYRPSSPTLLTPTNFTVTGPGSYNITLPSLNSYSANFKDALGYSFRGIGFTLRSATSGKQWTNYTDTAGNMSLVLPADTYSLKLEVDRHNTVYQGAIPERLTTGTGSDQLIDLTTSGVSQNVSIDLAAVTVTLKNIDGSPIANAYVYGTNNGSSVNVNPTGQTTGVLERCDLPSFCSIKTDGSGIAVIYLPIGSSATVSAQTSGVIASAATGQITGDMSLTLQVYNTLSGILKDSNNNALSGAQISLKNSTSGQVYSAVTNTSGGYSIPTLGGTFTMSVNLDRSSSVSATAPPGLFSTDTVGPTITLTGNATQNLTLPVSTVTVTTKNSLGVSTSGTPVSATGSGSTTLYTNGTFPNSTVTPPATTTSLPTSSPSGQAVVYLPNNLTYSKITAHFPSGPVDYSSLGQLTSNRSITIQEPHRLYGKITDATAAPVNGAVVDIIDPTTSTLVATATTDASGNYMAPVAAGTYDISVTPPAGSQLRATSYSNFVVGTASTALNVILQPANSTLSGRVVNGANEGVANVTVQIVSPSDHANVYASAATNTNGNYSADVAPGTYDVIFTPSGNTYSPTTKTSIDLTTDSTLDVALVLAPRTFSGRLLDGNGQPINGATLTLHNQGGQTVSETTGDVLPDGSFQIQLNPATYSLTITGTSSTRSNSPLATLPDNFTLSGGAIDLTGDVTQDLTVDTITQTFTTTNGFTGAPEGGVSLSLSTSSQSEIFTGSGNFAGHSIFSVTSNLATDPNPGQVTLVLLAGSYFSGSATPPSGADVLFTTFPSTGPLTDGGNTELALNAIIRHFSGSLYDHLNREITGASVSLSGSAGHFFDSTPFNISATPYLFGLQVTGAGDTVDTPEYFTFSGPNVDLTAGDVNQDLKLNAAPVHIQVTDPSGQPLDSVTITLTCTGSTTEFYPGSTSTGSSRSSKNTLGGLADIPQVVGFNSCSFTASPIPGFLTTTGSFTNTGGTFVIQMLRDMKAYSGYVKDKFGTGINGVTIQLDGPQTDAHYSTTTTDHNGQPGYFEFASGVAPVSYSLSLSGNSVGAGPTAYVPDNFRLTGSVSISVDTTQNFEVTAVAETITSRDNRLNPVYPVGIDFSSAGSQHGLAASSSHISRTTQPEGDGQARTRLLMLYGTTYTMSADPPDGIGYINTTFNGSSPVLTDTETIIEFQNHIPLAPTNLQADQNPTNQPPVLTWEPANQADSYNIYRDGVKIGTSTTTSFTDNTLTSDGNYQYYVTGFDSTYSYEGPASNTVTVTYDTTSPTITPSATNADGSTYTTGTWTNQTVTVHFTCTDNLSGVANCPTDQTLSTETDPSGSDVTGIATDNTGNQGTSTPPFNVKIDQNAPVVTNLSWSTNPLLAGNATTLSVTATDALSGVSKLEYTINDGQRYSMTYDATSGTWQDTFGSDLPVNTYNIAVYATDMAGNTNDPPYMDILPVYSPGQGATGNDWLTPNATTDSLPILIDASPKPAQLKVGFTSTGQDHSTTNATINYVVDKNNSFNFESTTIDWTVIPPSGSTASVMVHGDLTRTVNGIETVITNVAVKIDVTIGTNGSADTVSVKFWQPGIDPANNAATWHVSGEADRSTIVIVPPQ